MTEERMAKIRISLVKIGCGDFSPLDEVGEESSGYVKEEIEHNRLRIIRRRRLKKFVKYLITCLLGTILLLMVMTSITITP